MKQIVAQAALASLAGAAVREQGSGTRAFRLRWKCVRHCLTNCLCVCSGTAVPAGGGPGAPQDASPACSQGTLRLHPLLAL